ncbi:MAG: MarR family winged helix-turn-helix transcriptional regulator [Devosia sp.]
MAYVDLLKDLFVVSRELGTGLDSHLKGLGLTSARVRVLVLLVRANGAVTQASIAERLHVESPTAVRIIDGLELLGHVRRVPTPMDRRAKMVELTETGAPLARQAGLLTDRLEETLMEGLDAADVEATQRVLAVLMSKIAVLKSADIAPRHDPEAAA